MHHQRDHRPGETDASDDRATVCVVYYLLMVWISLYHWMIIVTERLLVIFLAAMREYHQPYIKWCSSIILVASYQCPASNYVLRVVKHHIDARGGPSHSSLTAMLPPNVHWSYNKTYACVQLSNHSNIIAVYSSILLLSSRRSVGHVARY